MKRLIPLLVVALLLSSTVAAFSATGLSYTAGFRLQNLSGATANVVIDFYNQDGTRNQSVPDTIAANGGKTYFPLGAVSAGFNGSAVISSDQQVAAITNVYTPDLQRGDSYKGWSQGASTVNLPLVFKARYGNDSWFSVQNTTTTSTQVTVTYAGAGITGTCAEGPYTIAGNGSRTFDQSTVSCLPANFTGAAKITTTGNVPVAVVVMEVSSQGLMSYNGFTTADETLLPVMPLIERDWYGADTGVQVLNTGTQPTNVTIQYSPVLAGTACTQTLPVPAGQSVTFGYAPNAMPASCGAKFQGSAIVTANSANQPVVAIVNQVDRTKANASAYAAFNPASASANVSMPIINDRNYGIYTGFSVVNMGQQPTSVSCTFTGTGYTVSSQGALAPGAALVDVQLNKVASSYVGSASCTATGGDAKIGAIVNQIRNAAGTIDTLLTYPGINF